MGALEQWGGGVAFNVHERLTMGYEAMLGEGRPEDDIHDADAHRRRLRRTVDQAGTAASPWATVAASATI